jgi:hypothetical protein
MYSHAVLNVHVFLHIQRILLRSSLIEDKTRWSKLAPQFCFEKPTALRPVLTGQLK